MTKVGFPCLIDKFLSVISQQGFVLPSSYNSALFLCTTGAGTIILHMIITGDDIIGILSYFLGLEVTSSRDGYNLTRAKYASDLLSKAGLTDSKIVSSPLKYNSKLLATDGTHLRDATLYQQLVGNLITSLLLGLTSHMQFIW